VIQETSPDRGTTVYYYDADANLTKEVDALSITATYTYDVLDRLATVAYPADTAENVTYTYDQTGTGFAFGIGRLTSMADQAGTLTRKYDERGDVVSEARSPTGGGTSTTGYGYDAAQRIASITYPDGALVAYTRDAMGRITGVSGTPSGGSPTTLASSITYEPLGPWAGLTFGNGIVETPTWDIDYRITHLVDGTIQNISYTWNNDFVQVYTDNLASGNLLTNIDNDAAARIGSFQWTSGLPTIHYDNNNNRTGYGTYTFGMTAHTNKLASFNNGTAYTITNNANGNVSGISPAWTTGVTTLAYNNANRLSSVSGSSGTLGSYLYDGFGNRYSKTVGSTATIFTYAPDGTLLAENNGTSETDYVYINDRPLAMFNNAGAGTYTYLQDDRMGRPQVATNSSGTVVWKASYFPWGETLATSGSFVVNLRFPGQYYDAESGFSHNGFRDYWPQQGRYVEFDPIGLGGGINPYLYAEASPMKESDPSGLGGAIRLPRVPYLPALPELPLPPAFWPGTPENQRLVSATLRAIHGILNNEVDDASETEGSCPAKEEEWHDCEAEWVAARKVCRELIYEQLLQKAGKRKVRSLTGVTGGYTDVNECARGLVSEQCGGNAVKGK
jgi:RHS repeat-associated protein